jgi:hypothetical protein
MWQNVDQITRGPNRRLHGKTSTYHQFNLYIHNIQNGWAIICLVALEDWYESTGLGAEICSSALDNEFAGGVHKEKGSYESAHRSATSAKVSSPPTLPGNTMYGTLVCLAVGSSHRQMGTPGAACPRIMARFMFNPFVAASDEVMPPYRCVLVNTLEREKQETGLLTFAMTYLGLTLIPCSTFTSDAAIIPPTLRLEIASESTIKFRDVMISTSLPDLIRSVASLTVFSTILFASASDVMSFPTSSSITRSLSPRRSRSNLSCAVVFGTYKPARMSPPILWNHSSGLGFWQTWAACQ